MEEIKGIFEGDNAASNIEAVKGILKEKGLKYLRMRQVKKSSIHNKHSNT